MEEFSRSEMLFGKEAVASLGEKRVIVFGVGGVGGYVCEALARSGVGCVDIVDNDTVSRSNINRQIIALQSTVGRLKVDVMRERMLDINPNMKVNTFNTFFTEDNCQGFDFSSYDYVVDAIDTVSGKLALAVMCQECGTKIISSMGTGNKVNPCAFVVTDINKTAVCPLARAMRTELKKRGVKKLKVVYSEETPISKEIKTGDNGKRIPASCSFVPSVAGLVIASEVIKDLIKDCQENI